REHLRGKRVVNTHHHRNGCVRGGDLFECYEISDRIERESIVFFGSQHAEKSEIAELLDEGRLEVRIGVPLFGIRYDLRCREIARDTLYLALLFRQRKEIKHTCRIRVRSCVPASRRRRTS